MIGVDISDRSIKIAEIVGKDTLYLRTVCWSPLPAGHIRRGIIQDVPAVSAALEATFSKCSPAPLTDGTVVASIPETQSFVRVIELPQMSEAETDEAVQWAVRQHIPFDLERVYLDWQSLPGGQLANGRREVLVGAVQRDVVDPILEVLDGVGLKVTAVELEAQAIARSLLPRDAADIHGVLIIDIGATFTEIIFFENGAMRFTTSVQSGGDDLTVALARELNVDVNVAAEKKAVVGVTQQSGEDARVASILHTATRELLKKIERVVQEIGVQFRSENFVRAILLSGGSANLPGIEQVVAQVFPGVPIQKGTPWINLAGEAHRSSMALSPESASHFVTALGLALRPAEGERLLSGQRELNLLPSERRYLIAKRRVLGHVTTLVRTLALALTILSISAATTAGFLYAMGIFSSTSISATLEEEIQKYRQLRDEIAKQNTKLEFMNKVSAERIVWSQVLPEFFSRIPAGTSIERMAGARGATTQLSFSGIAANRSVLLSLEERLKDITWVEQVSAPHSNLIEPFNPPYTFDVRLGPSAREDAL